jgi:hypothetical protein
MCAAVVLLLLASLLVASCGGGGASDQEIAAAEKRGRIYRAEKEKERKLEHAIEQLKKERKAEKNQPYPVRPAPAPQPESSLEPPGPSGTDCGAELIAGPETSCGFAENVRAEYEYYIGSGSGTVEAYSAANDEVYSMFCTAAPHECSGAISATVYFP